MIKTVRRVMGPTYGASERGEEMVLSYPGVAFEVVANAQGGQSGRISSGGLG